MKKPTKNLNNLKEEIPSLLQLAQFPNLQVVEIESRPKNHI